MLTNHPVSHSEGLRRSREWTLGTRRYGWIVDDALRTVVKRYGERSGRRGGQAWLQNIDFVGAGITQTSTSWLPWSELHLSKWGLQTRGSITWDPARNTDSQPLSQNLLYWKLWGGIQRRHFNKPSGDSDAAEVWKSLLCVDTGNGVSWPKLC